MDRAAPPGLERVARLTARLVGAPLALVSLVDDRRQFFCAGGRPTGGYEGWRTTPLSHSFCQHVVTSGASLVVEDVATHPLVRDNPAVQESGVAAYAGMPLRDPDGFVLGSLCVVDFAPRVWTPQELADLGEMAELVMVELALRHENRLRRESELEARRLARAARSADRAKTVFLANISHEIRTPMNAIVGFTDLLLETALSTEQREYVGTIRRSSDNLLGFLARVLELVDLDSPNPSLAHYVFDLSEAVQAVVDRVSPAAAGKSLVILAHVGANVPDRVVGDRARMQAALGHLLDNAVKFTEKGRVSVMLERQPDAETGVVRVRFMVSDTGVGIDPSKIDRLFAPFSQGDDSLTRAYGGAGLGLALARRHISLMGGDELSVRSEVGKGTTFEFELPFGLEPRPKIADGDGDAGSGYSI